MAKGSVAAKFYGSGGRIDNHYVNRLVFLCDYCLLHDMKGRKFTVEFFCRLKVVQGVRVSFDVVDAGGQDSNGRVCRHCL